MNLHEHTAVGTGPCRPAVASAAAPEAVAERPAGREQP